MIEKFSNIYIEKQSFKVINTKPHIKIILKLYTTRKTHRNTCI